MSLFDEEIEDFTVHMKHKLLVHKHKGGFERLSSYELLRLLKEEVSELNDSLDENEDASIIRECADVANFAMFIAMKRQNRKNT